MNLHNKITKAHAVKALRELHQNKLIEGRAADSIPRPTGEVRRSDARDHYRFA
ncbi:hypothetical protein M747DRAFT_154373 [Aspergillus niger ATCC 13496]|uniref:Uncharacterized protein n=1 Tax=Aspergillus niger ATCC 13496 TaxID=1353008 RepID=A0A370C944_ASPNG|nr:hypothetical protein M747DRAFT_154373 [Aspergillus niger ATCC 13496]